jgi:hypothetical protein
MRDTLTPYEIGLARVLERLGKEDPHYADALVYQQRLRDNIAQARKYGDTDTLKYERAQIVDALNRMALKELRVSFNQLCDSERRIQLIMEGEIPDFTEERREILLGILASVLKVEPSDIRILGVLPGSIRVTVEIPEQALTHLSSLSQTEISLLVSVGIQKIEGDSIETLDFQPEHIVSEGHRGRSLFAPLVRQYRSLLAERRVAAIALFGTIVVAFIICLATLGAPVIAKLAERLPASPSPAETAMLTPMLAVTPIALTSISTSTPIPPTFTPTASPTPIPSFVFDFDDGTTQCWNVRTEPDKGSLGDRVTLTVNIGDNTSYALRFDVNLDSTTGYRSQIEYSKYYDCSDDGVIALLNKAVKLRADVFLPQDAPVPTSVEFWVQEGPERNWEPWYASPSVSLEHTQWVTVEWQADAAGFGLWQFPYQFGIEVKSEGKPYRGPVYFDNITITYQP